MRLIAGVTRVRAASEPPAAMAELSARERELLELVARGRSDAEIGAVDGEVAGLLAKLGVRDRIHAVLLAHEARVLGS